MRQDEFAPVVLFTYNRYGHTKKTIEALCKNTIANKTDVYIMVDYIENEEQRRNTQQLYDYLDDGQWKKYFQTVKITYQNKHKGLAKSVIEGVTDVINRYEKIIVLEDDIVTEPNFLEYMNDCLDFYKDDCKIWSISGYAIPEKKISGLNQSLYLSYRASSWGWATWKDRWETIDWTVADYKKFKYNIFKRRHFNRGGNDLAFMLDRQMKGDIDSWAVRWCYSQSMQNRYTVYPVCSLVENIGCDGSGTHYTSANYNVQPVKFDTMNEYMLEYLCLDKKICKDFYVYYSGGVLERIKKSLISLFYNIGLLQCVVQLKTKIYNFQKDEEKDE